MESKPLFVDTSAWYALADRSDRHHSKAVAIYPELLRKRRSLTTTNLIIAESYTLIRRSIGHTAAVAFLSNITASPRVMKVYSDRTLEEAAEQILRKYQDQEFSYTDAVSFATMERDRIAEAFSFDRHFKTAGFTLIL
jgi:predicted nucleic acid-binding protein